MKDVILIFQILISVALSVTILMQIRGSGLGTTFGDMGEQYRSKRGIEKLLYKSSVILTALFLITSVINLLVG